MRNKEACLLRKDSGLKIHVSKMDKTVVIVCGNALSALSGGAQILLDLKVGGKHGSGPKTIVKTLWTSCVEAVIEYCRIIFDLFPDQYQVRVE